MSIPLTPTGVEHFPANDSTSANPPMSIPLTPTGVEHFVGLPFQSSDSNEHSFDADRR